jgi:hypothetical protein
MPIWGLWDGCVLILGSELSEQLPLELSQGFSKKSALEGSHTVNKMRW